MTFTHVYWMLTLFVMTTIFNSIAAQFVITSNPDNQTICVGDTAVMNCGFDNGGSGIVLVPLAIINGTIHALNSQPVAGLSLDFISPANDTNASRIVVGPIGEQFIGTANFFCAFSLSPQVDTMTATLTVLGPPSFPTIRVEDVRLDSFTISWTVIPDVNNVCGPVMYNVTFNDDVTNTTSMTNITYSGLNYTTNYTVVVIPYNNAGPGTPDNITVTTLIPSAPFPPVSVQLSLKFVNGDVNITATWMAPQLSLNMTDILNYNLTLTINSTVFNTTVPANSTAVDVFAVFQNVNRTAFTNYSLSVAAVNSIGSSSFTRPASVVSNYIQEASVTEAVENITVSCNVVQSEPPLICRAVFYCDSEATTLNLSSGAVQNFMTTQSCNVTVQMVPSNNISLVLQEATFYYVSPSVQPTSPPSASPTPSPPNRDSNRSNDDDNSGATIAGIVVGVILIVAIVIVAVIFILLYYRHRRKGSHKPSSLHCNNTSGDETLKPIGNDSRDGSSPSQNSTDSPGSTDPIIPPYSTVQVTNYTDNRNGVQVEMAIVSQYSQISDEKINTANGDVTKSLQINKDKETPQYSMVHKPTKAEGKVDNYTDLANFGPYPCKNAPAERVEYTDVIPSNLTSHPQYSNMEHHHYGNGSTPHAPIDNQAHHLTIRN